MRAAPQRRTYAEIDSWRGYQRFAPERARLTSDREPVEEWWPWRDAAIHLDRYPAPAAPVTVILLHGGGGYGRLLGPFGVLFQSHGFEVVAPDLPGYGLSVVPPRMFTHDHWVDCVTDLIEAEVRRSSRPVVLFGMSLGGYLGYLAAAQGRRAAGVIATTLGDPRVPSAREQMARSPLLARLVISCLPLLNALVGGWRLPIKWFARMDQIANNPDLARLACADPLGGGNWVSMRFLRSLVTMRPAIEPEDFDLCPVLLAQPAADRWTTLEASQPFFDRIKGPKQLVLLENCGHLPWEEPGFTQLEQAAVAFLTRVSGERPGR